MYVNPALYNFLNNFHSKFLSKNFKNSPYPMLLNTAYINPRPLHEISAS